MISAVIFDFDGVIVDSEREKFKIIKSLLEKEGCSLEEKQYPWFIGTKTDYFLKEYFPQINKNKREEITEMWRKNRTIPSFFPEIKKIVEILKCRGAKLGIVTGSEHAVVESVLEKMGIRERFDILITGKDAPSKPSPVGYQNAIQGMGVSPEQTIIIEDSPAGVEAAKDAKARVFTVGPLDSGAEQHFKDHQALLTYFSKGG